MSGSLSRLKSRVHGYVENMRFASSHVKEKYSAIHAKIGEELQSHLDRDIVDMEVAMQTVDTLRIIQFQHLANGTTDTLRACPTSLCLACFLARNTRQMANGVPPPTQ